MSTTGRLYSHRTKVYDLARIYMISSAISYNSLNLRRLGASYAIQSLSNTILRKHNS